MLLVGESGVNFRVIWVFWGQSGGLYLWYMQKGAKRVLLGFIAMGLSTLGAQDVALVQPKLTSKMWGMGVNVRHFGYDAGLIFERPGLHAVKAQQVWLGVMKDPREMRVINERLPGSTSFAIERVTHNLSLRYQWGRSVVLADRQSRSDVGLRLNASLQVPLNYSWPTYIWLYQPAPLTDGYVAVKYDPSVQDVGLVGGTARYAAGFGDGSITPGLGGLISMQAEWGSYRNVVNRLIVGFGVDRYAKKLPMWYRPEMNRNFFPSVFVTFAVGFDYGHRQN